MKKIAIIGGGLAGAACAYVLKRAGVEPVIYEAGPALASGASGNDLGLYNPRLSATLTPEAEYYIHAFNIACQTFQALENVDYIPYGALHLITDEKREIRYNKTVKNWGWSPDDMRLVDAREASQIAGVQVDHDALYLPRSGGVSPQKLCAAYADGAEVHLNTKIESLSDIEADVVIVAGGMGTLAFEELEKIQLKSVRGQITYVDETPYSKNLKTALCYSGYIAPRPSGGQVVGSTFQRWLTHSDVLPEDNAENIEKLSDVAPDLAAGLEERGARAAVRTTSHDYFPVVGRVPDHDNVYVSSAHSSHGLVSSIAAAHLLADMILDRSSSLSKAAIERLSPARYYGAS